MTRAVLFGMAGVVVVGTAGFLAGRLSVTNTDVKVSTDRFEGIRAELEEWSVGPREPLTPAEWKQRFGSDVQLATRRVMAAMTATTFPDFDIDSLYLAYEFSRNLSVEQIQQALGEVGAAPHPGIGMMMEMILMRQWAALDGKAAITRALEHDGFSRGTIIHGTLAGWVKSDPTAAYEWYAEHREALEVRRFMARHLDGIVYGGLARADMGEALARIEGLDEERREDIVRAIARQVHHDKGQRRGLLESLAETGDAALLASAREAIVSIWCSHDPEAAAEFVEGLELEGGERDELEDELFSSWSRRDPQGALEWRVRLAESTEDKRATIAAHFGDWLRDDEVAASEWLARQPEEMQSDEAFESAARSLLVVNRPERAAAWTEQILDERARAQMIREVHASWEMVDQAAADDWVASLDAETRELVDQLGSDEETRAISGEALRDALLNELRLLEEATGLPAAELAAKREQLETLLDSFGDAEGGVPVAVEEN